MNISVKNCLLLKARIDIAVPVLYFFNLGSEIIKENCEFNFYFNKTDVKPGVLDGEYQIILMNWSSYKRIICTHNNNIPIDIPSHPYVLLNRSILCNCNVEA